MSAREVHCGRALIGYPEGGRLARVPSTVWDAMPSKTPARSSTSSADATAPPAAAARSLGRPRATRVGRNSRNPNRPLLKPPCAPTAALLRAIYNELLDLPNVAGCAIGYKVIGGRRTKELAVVCCVRDKVPSGDLGPKERVPSSLAWGPSGGAPRSLPTDVVVLGAHARQAGPPDLAPGDMILSSAGAGGGPLGGTGTVGIAMEHPTYGAVVTTAGHVLGQATPGTITYPPGAEPTIVLRNPAGGGGAAPLQARGLKASVTPQSDYALLAPIDGETAGNVYGGQYALGRLYIPDPSDVSTSLRVLSATGVRTTTLRYVDALVPVGATMLAHALLTDFATTGGDSGACLVDPSGRPWGLLVGFTTLGDAQYSVFTPAYLPFLLEGAQML